MEFLDRKEEIARLKNSLSRKAGPSFIVIYGRRRLGKSTLIKKVLTPTDIYYMAGDFVDRIQLDMFRDQLAKKFPEIANIAFPSWEELFLMVNRLATNRFTVCLDEFPYIVKQSPSLPSVLQRLLDSKELKFDIIICGSSQRMMQKMVLSYSEPLYGHANAILNIQPIPIAYLGEALDTAPVATIEEHSVWGGVPRYWELRKEYETLHNAVLNTMFSPTGVLYDEPKHLFLDDMSSVVQSESLMSLVAAGASRISEIASRVGREATALSAPLDRLMQMHYLRREIPYGESPRKSKKGIYRINDPLMRFYYTFVTPNLSNIGRGRLGAIKDYINSRFNEYVAGHWEYLCREAVSGNTLFGRSWGEASRWWGSVLCKKTQSDAKKYSEMEFDLIAESTDGEAILVGECKWTNPEFATQIHKNLTEKIALLPFARNKKIIPVLFLKNKPRDNYEKINILYPHDVVKLTYGDVLENYICKK